MTPSNDNLIPLNIRRVIYEKFNDPDIRFTNDEIFEILQKDGSIEQSLSIDDMESYFDDLTSKGLVRNIAQNFTTIWFKLFETMEKVHCSLCNNDLYLAKTEERVCPNCNKKI